MNWLKFYFWYSKSQRNGIIILAMVIALFQLINYFLDRWTTHPYNFRTEELNLFQHKIDSVKSQNKKQSDWKNLKFNPNYLSDYKAYSLGMSLEEIDRLFTFRSSGKYINSAGEFQSVTKISDSLLKVIAPKFRFTSGPKSTTSGISLKSKQTDWPIRSMTNTIDLNRVNVNDLLTIEGIDKKMANRIISFRNKLQGFSFEEQIFEVYQLKKHTADKILQKYKIVAIPKIDKVNVNAASFKEILHLPYLDYDLTLKIVQYRDEVIHIDQLDELKKIDSFPLEKFDRIALYLTAQ